jgi:glycosyltransferase involved in cell wall biosynthesis
LTTRYGFVSTFPPTQCGLATFTASLRDGLIRHDDAQGLVVRLVEQPERRPGPEVVAQIAMNDRAALYGGVARLNQCDVVIVQHEYGVYGGTDGDEILPLLDALEVPSIVVLHTVPLTPTSGQREVLEAVVARCDSAVTMSVTARDRLALDYAVDMKKVSVIAHGAPVASAVPTMSATFRSGTPTILTWGLLGPGKGIEWGIEAMARLRDLDPMPRYVVAGQTHPKVIARDGEAYRTSLQALVRRLALDDVVRFDGHYRDARSLAQLVESADVVLLPYDSIDQVTSGVLIEAVAAGKPVVATRFPHAVELLGGGAGIVVTHRTPEEIAVALRTVITNGELAARMARAAASTAPTLSWAAVADQYRGLAERLIVASIAA